MQLKALKLFCDVVGLRSFSKAADQNGLTQSGASQVVHHLEQELGVKLIDRSRRPFVLTPEGDLYYEGCREMVERYFALEEQLRALHKDVEGRVRVAAIYSVGLHYMSRCVEDFQALYPKADVRVEYRHPHRVYEEIEHDLADVGLVSYPKASRTIETLPWQEERVVLVCAPSHPFAERNRVTLEELDGTPLVHFDQGLPIRRNLDQALQERGAAVHVALEFDNIETIKRAVEIDEGVALLPEPTVEREVEAGTLVTVPLADVRLVRPLGIIHRRGKELGTTAVRFIEFLAEGAADAPKNSRDGAFTGGPNNGQGRATGSTPARRTA